MSMQSHAHRGIFRTKLNIYDGAFFTSVKPYFKNVLNLIKLPLSSIFHTTHTFVEKICNSENFGRKSLLLTIEHIFFQNQKLCNGIASSTNRSSHRRYSLRKGVLRNFTKFTGKHLYHSLFFNKVTGLSPTTLLKNRPWHSYFPVNFVKFLRTPFLQNTSWRLLLKKKGFLNQHVIKVSKLLVFVLFSFFHYFKYYGQKIFFKNNGALFNS